MKTNKKTKASFVVFLFSSLIFMILLSQTTSLNQLNVFQKLTQEELEWGKGIVEQCDVPYERYEKMKEILFRAEQELLNKNPEDAAKYFNQIRPELGTCAFELSGKPHPLDTFLGRASAIVTIFSAGITVGLVMQGKFKKKSE